MRHLFAIAVLLLAAIASRPSLGANGTGTDFTDIYWNPAESGWGVTLSHQGDTIFATLFVYGTDGTTRWYSGAAIAGAAGTTRFAGELVESHGPAFSGATFDPALVTKRVVGTITLDMTSSYGGTMTYTVDGTTVSKSIQRQTFKGNPFIFGYYLGATLGSATNCGIPSGNFELVTLFTLTGGIQVSNTPPIFGFTAARSDGFTCRYDAPGFVSRGRIGEIKGTLSCTNGRKGTFEMSEIDAGEQGFFSRFKTVYDNGCIEVGRMGGVNRTNWGGTTFYRVPPQ